MKQIKRVLISVSDKSYLEELARAFHQLGIEIISTGGTAQFLKRLNVPIRTIEDFAGTPEIFDGRIKTLTFGVQGAILFDRQNPKHVAEAAENKIEPIDAVICNFYPFEEEVAKNQDDPTTLPQNLIEKIDIGGPTMVRSAAKNYTNVLVVTNPSDYDELIQELRSNSAHVSLEFRKKLMIKAFQHVYSYDQAIAEAFSGKKLRYGENPHQKAFFIQDENSILDWSSSLETDLKLKKFELSYNNILDAHAAFGAMVDAALVAQTGHGACAIVKHNNPCGLATAKSMSEAFEAAWNGDPVSSFGGVVAFSAQVTKECIELFKKKFIEVLIAPSFEEGVIEELSRDKKKLRIIKIKPGFLDSRKSEIITRQKVEGGVLVQTVDGPIFEEFENKTKIKFPNELYKISRFGIVAAKWLKSNAITIVYQNSQGGFELIGAGSGQPNRIDSIKRLAIPKSFEILNTKFNGDKIKIKTALENCVVVSDAFFPFSDSIEEISKAGFKYVIEPGGSIKDNEVIEMANACGVSMAFTSKRHFKH